MPFEAMTNYVTEHAGVDREAAKALLEEALIVFAEGLTRSEAERLAHDLPAPASEWITNAKHGNTFDPGELYERVRSRSGTAMGLAVERAQVAVATMVRELRPQTREWLERRMGDNWKPLLEEPRRPSSPSPPRPAHAHLGPAPPHTLAEGRVGSAAPLSESAPTRTQRGSVAEDNPHADRKVSSGHNVHAEPISSGHPRSKHPVSEDHDEG